MILLECFIATNTFSDLDSTIHLVRYMRWFVSSLASLYFPYSQHGSSFKKKYV